MLLHFRYFIPLLLTIGLATSIKICLAQQPIPAKAQTQTIVLVGGTLHTASSTGVMVGDLVIENGKITQLGKVEVSKDALKIDVTGKHIYPGFIAPNTLLGLAEIEAARPTLDYAESGSINPNLRTQIAYNTDSKVTPTIRTNGVLVAQICPTNGLLCGISSIMYLEGWHWEDATVVAEDGLFINIPSYKVYGPDKEGKQRESQEKRSKELYTAFEAAEAYYTAKRAGKILSTDQRWEAMIPVLEGKRTVYIRANELKQMYVALDLTEKYHLKTVIVGGSDAWQMANILAQKNISVILERIHSLPDREDEDLDLPYKKPKLLKEAGVKFCLSMDGFWQQRNLPFLAGTAAAYGLDKEEALKAITIHTAEILGVSKRIGSLEVGKEATLLVSEGDALDMQTNKILYAFVQGKSIALTNIQTELYQKYKQKYELK